MRPPGASERRNSGKTAATLALTLCKAQQFQLQAWLETLLDTSSVPSSSCLRPESFTISSNSNAIDQRQVLACSSSSQHLIPKGSYTSLSPGVWAQGSRPTSLTKLDAPCRCRLYDFNFSITMHRQPFEELFILTQNRKKPPQRLHFLVFPVTAASLHISPHNNSKCGILYKQLIFLNSHNPKSLRVLWQVRMPFCI